MGKWWKVRLEVDQHIEADKIDDAVEDAMNRIASNSVRVGDPFDVRIVSAQRLRAEAEERTVS